MKKLSVKAYVLGAIFLVVAIAMLADRMIVSSFDRAVLEDARINLAEIESFLTSHYRSYHNDIHFLYATPPVSGLSRASRNNGIDPLDNTTIALWRGRLSEIFKSFIQNNSAYYQLRLLDDKGYEVIRVERLNGRVFAVDSQDLQDKSDRYYFTATKALPEGQLFVSHIDLNREHGRVSFPHTPTLRMALPVFTENNEFFGELVANIDVSEMLASLDVLVGPHLGIILTDFEHYFIKHPDASYAFSRDLAPQKRFITEYQQKQSSTKGLGVFEKTANGEMNFGAGQKVTVEVGEAGGVLYAYVLLAQDYYQKQLGLRRIESLGGLAIVLLLSIFALHYLNRNNERLSKLLAVAEEAKAAVDVAEDAVITVNSEWHINTINRAFERMFLLSEKECVGRQITDLLKQFNGSEVAAGLKSHIGTGFKGIEWRMPVAGGTDKWFHCKVNSIDKSRAKAKFAIVIRDITAEKMAMLEVAEANRQLEEKVEKRTRELKRARDEALEVSELKTNFISTISHEMRTPLNGIVGATNLLKNELLDPKQTRLLGMAESSVATLKRLINDILDLSKIEAGKLELDFQQFSPERLIENVCGTMSVVAHQKDLGFYVDTSELNFSLVQSDPHRLTQVLNNVLNNAIKFTAEGYIHVACWSQISDQTAWLMASVSDTGKGIPTDKIDKLFKAFSQADKTIASNYGGTGLGLSICREILELLGGSISVESKEGQGSCFSIKVPVEKWQLNPVEASTCLAEQSIGTVTYNEMLEQNLRKHLISHGAAPCKLEAPYDVLTVSALDSVFIDAGSSNYALFCEYWQSWRAQNIALPGLFVISRQPLVASMRPELSSNLVEPVFRYVLLTNLLGNDVIPGTDFANNGPQHNAKSEQSKSADFSGLTVLIVDDNEINRQIAAFMLEPCGAKIVTAEHGQEAIGQLQKNNDVKLVLMDCNMPVLNGYDAARAIRNGAAGEAHKEVPIIAMTANAMQGENEKCVAAGMDDYLTKPIDTDLLLSKIGTLVALTFANQPTTISSTRSVWQKDEALARLAGNEVLLGKVLLLFIQQSDSKLAALKQAIAAQDKDAIRFAAHSLKGVAAEVGANGLRELLSQLESKLEAYSKAELEAAYAGLSEELAAVVECCKHYVDNE